MENSSENKTIYLQQIHQLKQLQVIDDEIFKVEEQLEKAPEDLEILKKRFATIDAQRSHILDKITHLKEQTVRLEREIEEENLKLKKSKNKLMATGTEREFNAVTREIDNLEKMTQPREDERIALFDELKTQNDALESVDSEYQIYKEQIETTEATLAEILRDGEEKKADLFARREVCANSIPSPIFRRYEFIRTRLEHPVIVPLKDGVCSSCHIAIPPQLFNELLRGEQIFNCPNCQRLIVWLNDYLADDPDRERKIAEANGLIEPEEKVNKKQVFFEDINLGFKE